MRRFVNGMCYDTDKVKAVTGRFTRGIGIRDIGFLAETLYKTASGNWFLVGIGGQFTPYCGVFETPGKEKLFPLTEEDALDWLEAHAQELVGDHFPYEDA